MYAAVNSNQASSRSSVAWIVLIRFFHIITSSYASIHGIQISTFFLTNMNFPFKFSLEVIFQRWEQYLLQRKTQHLRNPTRKVTGLKENALKLIYLVQNTTTMKVSHRNKSTTSYWTVVMGRRSDVWEWLQIL